MISTEEDAARRLARETIEPRDRVFEAAVAFAAEIEKRRKRVEWNEIGIDPWAVYSAKLNIGPGDDAGQAEAADSGAKHPGIAFRAANYEPIARTMQTELTNVRAESSGTVMIFPVNIIGDGAADRDELRAGSDGQKPALGQK